MLNVFKGLPMRSKIVGIVLLPVAFYLLHSWSVFNERRQSYNDLNYFESRIKAAQNLSDLTGFTQAERGKSLIFSIASGKVAEGFLNDQRLLVDKNLTKFKAEIAAVDDASLTQRFTALSARILGARKLVNDKAQFDDIKNLYNEIVMEMILLNQGLLQGAPASYGTLFSALLRLELAREKAAQFRGAISSVFTADVAISPAKLLEISSLNAKIDANLNSQFINLSPGEAKHLNQVVKLPHWKLRSEMLNQVAKFSKGGAYGESGPESFAALSKIVDDIGALVDSKRQHIVQVFEADRFDSRNKMFFHGISTCVVLGLIVFALALFMKSFGRRIDKVVGNLSRAKDSLISSFEEIRNSGNDLTAASLEASSAIQETVSSISEMKSMIASADERVKSAAESSKQVSQKIIDGEESLKSLLTAMEEISDATEKLDEINQLIDSISSRTSVIHDIVFKTQLLSFNASIEAAKAGEHGLGFAVVAEEVGKLAEVSGKSANEISTILLESKQTIAQSILKNQDLIRAGLEKSDTVAKVFKGITGDIRKIDRSTQDVLSASKEQRTGIEQVTTAISQIDESVQRNVAGAQVSENMASKLGEENEFLSNTTKSLVSLVYGGRNEERSLSLDRNVKPIKKDDEPVKVDPVEAKDQDISADDDSFKPVA